MRIQRETQFGAEPHRESHANQLYQLADNLPQTIDWQ